MKKLILTATFFLGCFIVCAQPATISALAKNGALHVEKGLVLNAHGVPPQLRGVSFSWSIWGGRKYYNPAVVSWLASDFKVSFIRVAMAVQPDHGYLQEPEIQQQLVVNVIDKAVKEGIYVLIDWHDHNGNQHVEQSKEFFGDMAQRYKGVPNILYEVWNEPEKVSLDTVKHYAVEIIKEIRKYDPENLIVVGSPHWDQDVDLMSHSPITEFKNIAYSFHFYASDNNHQQGLRAKGDEAIKNGLPLIVTEWGVGEASGDGQFDKKRTETWLKWMEDNKLCWVNWNITDKNETTAILMPDAPATGNWTEEQLTPAGIYIRKKLLLLNNSK